MGNYRYDVTGIGNAIVDVLAQTTDSFIESKGFAKGTMTLIDAEQAESLYAEMSERTQSSGGSAGNTMAGIASLGGKGAYIGKVRGDELGASFREDIRKIGVDFETPDANAGPPTARCLIFVTPDAQRTMCTFLGVCAQLAPDDVDEAMIRGSQFTYLEGYLWDRPEAKEAFVKAAELAHAAGAKVSLTLSDPFCVERHRAEFQDLVSRHVDLLFANEVEILSLYQVESFDDAVDAVRGKCELTAITRSEKGSVVVNAHTTDVVDAHSVESVVDTTGAGDLYAAGFLRGLTSGLSPAESARLGSICASEVISHVGGRPAVNLLELARTNGVAL